MLELRYNGARIMASNLCIIFILLIFFIFEGCNMKQTEAKNVTINTKESGNRVRHILFPGASEASGYGIENSFPMLVEKLATGEGLRWKVHNASRAGASTREGLAQIRASLKSGVIYDRAFISLGLADAIYAYSIQEIKDNLRGMVKELRVHNPGIKIYLTRGKIFQYHTLSGLPAPDSLYYKEYSELFAEVARTQNIQLAPVYFS